jgi:ribonuclease VapC
MVVVDSSALVSIARHEEDWLPFVDQLTKAVGKSWLAEGTYIEVGIVLIQQGIFPDKAQFDTWLSALGVNVDATTPIADAALEAFVRFGKGRHPAKLNYGDCFSYALAKTLDAPLLFKGNDFSQTDIRSALQPT